MLHKRFYVLVNTLPSLPEHDFLLCDKEGEMYTSLADALTAGKSARAEFDNPWIQVFRIEEIDASDMVRGAGEYTLARPGTGEDLLGHDLTKLRARKSRRFCARFGAKN